jgi:hypothetical protein
METTDLARMRANAKFPVVTITGHVEIKNRYEYTVLTNLMGMGFPETAQWS